MLFELCLEIGEPHPDYLIEKLDTRQLCEWRSFYHRNPFGELRRDLRQMVMLHYMLAPHTQTKEEPPSPIYPYFGDTEDAAALAEEFFRLKALDEEQDGSE